MTAATAPRRDVEAIKRTHPIRAVLLAEGVQLSPAGPGTWKGCCPFHDDRRPSLLVDERDQHYHCFGCGAHGDAIGFLMRRHSLGFAAACDRLAGGPAQYMPLPAGPPQETPASGASPVKPAGRSARRWDRLPLEEQVVLNTAATLYHDRLWRERRAIEYLRARGIADWVIRACGLGYADGHSLEAYLRRRSGLRIAQALGLLRTSRPGDGGRPLREFFAGRIVVPELRGGRCIWLIGRSLTDQLDRPKYLALPGERPVLGFERAAGGPEVFVCEGIFDYLTAVGWRLPAFSPCGTHLPPERLGFLRRARVVYGVFDGDPAGAAAAERFGGLLGPRWRSLRLPDGLDLNDLGRRPEGRAEFFRLIATARRQAHAEVRHVP